MSRRYLDFEVSVTAEGSGYRVTAGFGERSAEHQFSFPFEVDELQSFYGMFGRSRRRRMESPQMERTQIFGDRLYRAVFTDEIDRLLVASMLEAEAEDRGLRIRLRLDDAPVLVNLPWEYLYRQTADDFPALSNWTPVVRSLAVEEGLPPARVEPPLKILAMISNPVEYQDTLDVDAEWDRLHEALGTQMSAGLVEVERLAHATEAELQATLRRSDFHVFHFIGHGEFSEQADDGVLLVEDERRRTKLVTGRALGTILKDCRPLRLVVLNNCEGARTSDLDPFAGAAQSLLRKGIPAVVAMQFEVTDEAAIAFSQGFYGGLGDGFPVEAALSEARKSMNRVAGQFEFGSPVLYLATPNGEIFDVAGHEGAIPDEEPPSERTPETPPVIVDDAGREPEMPVEEPPSQRAADTPPVVLDGAEPEPAQDPGGLHRQATTEAEAESPPMPAPQTPSRRRGALILGLVATLAIAAIAVALLRNGSPSGTDMEAVHLVNPPTIDGDSSDWPSATVYATPHEAEGEPNPRVSSEWMLGWDEEALYLFVEVIDPEVTVGSPERLFLGDGINFNFGSDPTGVDPSAGLRPSDTLTMVGPSDEEASHAMSGIQVATSQDSSSAQVCDPGAGSFGQGREESRIVAAAARTPTGYNLEAAVPWFLLDQAPRPGAVFGMNLTVADANTDGGRRGSRTNLENRAETKHCPATWGTVVLSP